MASPIIAGPATLTAAISFPAHYGMLITLGALFIAVLINYLVMINSKSVNKLLKKFNLSGALIRITGLIVATIGVQMMLDGLSAYIKTLGL